jgi:hypothetical protein
MYNALFDLSERQFVNVVIYWFGLGLGLAFRIGLGLFRARVRAGVSV